MGGRWWKVLRERLWFVKIIRNGWDQHQFPTLFALLHPLIQGKRGWSWANFWKKVAHIYNCCIGNDAPLVPVIIPTLNRHTRLRDHTYDTLHALKFLFLPLLLSRALQRLQIECFPHFRTKSASLRSTSTIS